MLDVSVPGPGMLKVDGAGVGAGHDGAAGRASRGGDRAARRRDARAAGPDRAGGGRTVAGSSARPAAARRRATPAGAAPGATGSLAARVHGLYATRRRWRFTHAGRPKLAERLPVDFIPVKRKASEAMRRAAVFGVAALCALAADPAACSAAARAADGAAGWVSAPAQAAARPDRRADLARIRSRSATSATSSSGRPTAAC